MKNRTSQVTRSGWWLPADLAALVPALFALALAVVVVAHEYRIARNPMTARAVVVEKLIDKSGESWSFDLRFRFVSAGGSEYTGVASASREIFDRTSLGDPLEIRYAGDAPQYHAVTSDMHGPWSFILVVLGAVTLLIPAVFLGWAGIRHLPSDLIGLRRVARRS